MMPKLVLFGNILMLNLDLHGVQSACTVVFLYYSVS